MLAELPEDEARGAVAAIYAEIRRLWAVPYVSALQRHLATRPGMLAWTWSALAPAFRAGRAQSMAWTAARDIEVPALPPMSAAALRQLGVDATARRAIAGICAGFVRVAPVNLVFAGLLRQLLAGERPRGQGWPDAEWQPPAPVPPLPAMVEMAMLGDDARTVLLQFGTRVGGAVDAAPFVPGLYRMLAHWPAYTAHLATVLPPHVSAAATETARTQLLGAIDEAVGRLFHRLPPPADAAPMPPAGQDPGIVDALATYRRTSPEMVLFGRMISDSLLGP